MKIIVAGGGKIGEALSKLLVKEKHDVILIEKDANVAEKLAETLDALILHGDATDKEIMKDANIENADAVVASTGDDKTNLMICEIAKASNVPNIITRINDPENEYIFTKIGVTNVVDTTKAAVAAFKKALEKPGKQLVNIIAGGKGEVFEITVKEGSKFIDKKVSEFSKDFVIAFIYRDDKCFIPKNDTKIKEGDILTIVSPTEKVKKIEAML